MRWAAGLLVVLTVIGAVVSTGGHRVAAGDAGDAARTLAERHAPILMLPAQEGACDAEGESFAPAAVDIVLDNPQILLRQVGRGDPVVAVGPSAADVYGLGEGFFLDFPGSSLEPGCLYEKDFDRYSAGLPATVYAHIAQQPDAPGRLALQYWFYWYFNDWNNTHESDWEGIQLLFEASSVDEALAEDPVSVGYAQHEGGERAAWISEKLDREGRRPVVYPSRGSHASYFGPDVYLGRGASEGFGCDTSAGPSTRVNPDVILLPDSVDHRSDEFAWLGFDGRWGERRSGAFSGPTGPTSKPRWSKPIDWHDELRPSAVVVPGGSSRGNDVVTAFCGVVEWGSGVVVSLSTSPGRVVVTLLVVFLSARWLVRRTVWTAIPPLPVRRRRFVGQVIRGAGDLLRRMPSVALFGLWSLPAVILAGAFARIVAEAPLVRQFLDLVGSHSAFGLLIALAVGSVVNVAAFVVVSAAVATHLEALTTVGEQETIRSALRRVGQRRAALASGFVRGYGTVVLLLVSVVGTPWAIRLLVRSQFMPQAVMIDDLDGRAGLDRSADLVRGRWWQTAAVSVIAYVLVTVVGMAIGLLLLVVVSGLPLWAFSAVVTMVYALLAPFIAVALTLLWGDAAAQGEHS